MLHKKTIAVAIMGPENVGKSAVACGMAERVCYVGKRTHMKTIESTLGYPLTHVEDFLAAHFDELKERAVAAGLADWKLPSEEGYHIDAWMHVVDTLTSAKWAQKFRDTFDLIVFDECTAGLARTFTLWKEDAEQFAERRAKAIAYYEEQEDYAAVEREEAKSHPFVSSKGSTNTQAMFLSIKNEPTRFFDKADALGVNTAYVFHIREKEGTRKVHPRSESRNSESVLVEFFQILLYMGHDPSKFMDGFSTPTDIFAPFFYHENNNAEYATKDKEGIVKGHVPANLWAYAYSAGVRTEDHPSRAGFTDQVLAAAKHFQDNKIADPRAQAIYVWEAMKDTQWAQVDSCANIQAIRIAYQRAAALAHYQSRKNANPFDFPLPGTQEAIKQSVSHRKGPVTMPSAKKTLGAW